MVWDPSVGDTGSAINTSSKGFRKGSPRREKKIGGTTDSKVMYCLGTFRCESDLGAVG